MGFGHLELVKNKNGTSQTWTRIFYAVHRLFKTQFVISQMWGDVS